MVGTTSLVVVINTLDGLWDYKEKMEQEAYELMIPSFRSLILEKTKTSIEQQRKKRSSTAQFSSVQACICAFGKAHMRSTPSLRRFPNLAFETVQMFV